MEVRPSRNIKATFAVAMLSTLIAAALAGHHRHDSARPIAAVELRTVVPGDDRPTSVAPELLRPQQTSSRAPAATAGPRPATATERPPHASVRGQSDQAQAGPE